MKKITLILLFLSLGLSSIFTSCSKDDDAGSKIIGTWEIVSESTRWGFTTVTTEVMVFNSDKSGTMTTYVKFASAAAKSEAYDFTYKFNGSSLTINSKDLNQTTKASVDGDILTIKAEANGEVFERRYTKLSQEEIEEREEQREKEKETNAILEKLVGEWNYYSSGYNQYGEYDVYDRSISFKNDMTGNLKILWTIDDFEEIDEDFSFEYEVSEDKLTLTINNNIIDYKMVFNSNKLTLILIEDSESRLTYTKVE